jgi:hypothetical protein
MELFAFLTLRTWLTDINAQPKIFNRQLYQSLKNPPDDFSLDLFLMLSAKRLTSENIVIQIHRKQNLIMQIRG